MQVVEEGHGYLIKGGSLWFIKRVNGESIREGTTNEEVLEVLIDRLRYLQGKLPCLENADALEHLKAALYILEERTRKRESQGVEGTDNLHF